MSRVLGWVLNHPFATLVVPPALLLIQFLDLLLIFKIGLPESMAQTHGPVAICIMLLFAFSLISIPTLMLAVRQVFLLPNKIGPSLGIMANGFYFVAFIFFFVLCFVVRTFT